MYVIQTLATFLRMTCLNQIDPTYASVVQKEPQLFTIAHDKVLVELFPTHIGAIQMNLYVQM